METDMPVFEAKGGCLCGAIRFRVTAKPLAAYYCHCQMCQRGGGGPFATGATVPIENFTFTKGKPVAYESSPGVARLFCGNCGSTLGMQKTENPTLADFCLGQLDDPNAIKPEFHFHTASAVSWCHVADDLPQHTENGPIIDELWGSAEG